MENQKTENAALTCREEFYNFKDLCDAALHKDSLRARKILEAQSRCLFRGQKADWESIMVFLTSMNRSFYNYILYTMNLSLYECCYENSLIIHHCRTKKAFFSLADTIIRSYCDQLSAIPHNNLYIVRAKEYITRNLDQHLNLERVAAHVFISKTYLSELFTTYTGKCFSVYVTEQRMKRAQYLLSSTNRSIHDIGQSCGFISAAYFSTVFTKWIGMSPRQYRMNQNKGQNKPHSA